MDDVLASILKDLEIAEMTLKSTSHLLDDTDQTGHDTTEGIPSPILHLKDDFAIEKTSEVNELVENNNTSFAQDSKEWAEENTNKLSEFFVEEPMKSFVESATDESNTQVNDKDPKDQFLNEPKEVEECLEVIDSQNNSSIHQSEEDTDMSIPVPSTNPYINFVQDFKAKYKGHEVTATTLIALAAAKWRRMAKEEKQAYKHIGKSHCEKNKQVEKLKKYIKSFKMSEDSLFQSETF